MPSAAEETFDVAIVGGGAAGLPAAIEARRAGARVVLIEKEDELGGTSSFSLGMATASRTEHQRRAGIEDSPEAHFEDAGLFAPGAPDNAVLRRTLARDSVELIPWLSSLGLSFLGPMPEPPHRVPRMHTVVPTAAAIGFQLGRECRRLGVEIRMKTRVTRLLVEGGRVRGVVARRANEPETHFVVEGGVILAAGDYAGNRELKVAFGADIIADVNPVNPGSSGDGHRMGIEAGSEVLNGPLARGPVLRFVPPKRKTLMQRIPPYAFLTRPMAWAASRLPAAVLRPFLIRFITTALGPSRGLFAAGAVLVDRNGERFASGSDNPGDGLRLPPGGTAFIVLDGELRDRFQRWPDFVSTAPNVAYAYIDDYKASRPDITFEAATIEDLAHQLGMQAGRLGATLQHAGRARRGPYVALGPLKQYIVCTEGGLRVNGDLEVLDRDGGPISGLYAAGSTGQGGMRLDGHGHHLGWAVVSGRIAGRNAAMRSRSRHQP